MALSVTGIDSNGRVTPKGTNVLIPKESAGIGDLVFKSGSSIRIYGRGTVSATTIDGYTLYGAIYGFVAGMAMIVAPNGGETSAAWLSSGSSTVGPEYGGGTPLMRNGQKHTYVQMNTNTNQSYITGGSSAPYQLASAYQATSLTSSSFVGSASADVKARFGSWLEYIRQTLRVNGAPGTPFGAVATGVKVHEFGRWMTKQLVTTHGSTAAAAYHCYNYNEGSGTWWLPSMFELGELMIDEHLNKVNENSSVLSVSAGSDRWSCVRVSSGSAWIYGYSGMSADYGFTYGFTVRPVTLLKLV